MLAFFASYLSVIFVSLESENPQVLWHNSFGLVVCNDLNDSSVGPLS